MWRPIELAVVVAGNLDRPVDDVNTIGMILTLAKADTKAGYPSILAEDEGRDPDYISLACLKMRQRFRQMVVEPIQLLHPLINTWMLLIKASEERDQRQRCGCNAQGSPGFGTAPHLNGNPNSLSFMFIL
eukprot:Gb_30036 [translate_table: standard]